MKSSFKLYLSHTDAFENSGDGSEVESDVERVYASSEDETLSCPSSNFSSGSPSQHTASVSFPSNNF